MNKVLLFVVFTIFFANCSSKSKADSLLSENLALSSSNKIVQSDELPFSPFEINDLVKKNKTLNIKSFWKRIGLDDNAFDIVIDYGFRVSAASIDNDNLDDAVLEVWNPATAHARFVLFKQQINFNSPQEQWKFVGHIDISEQQYSPPDYQVAKGAEKSCLVVKQLTGRGSGVASYRDYYYEIKKGELKSVLDYPSKGYDVNNNPWDRIYESKLVNFSDDEVEVKFSVNWIGNGFDDLPDDEPVFSETNKVFYNWNKAKDQFVFNRTKSNISKNALEDIYNFDSIDENSFLTYTFKNLLSVVEHGNDKQKLWLQNTLLKLPINQQTRQINEVLNRKKVN